MKNKLIKLAWLFIIGSFIGFIVETLFTLYYGHYEVRKGLIYGPFIPVYGLGAMLYFMILSNIKFEKKYFIVNIFLAFLLTAVLGGITEYLCSYFQEKMFGTISWDYSDLRYNFAGRTSLKHCAFWGMFGCVYYLSFIPLLNKVDTLLDNKIILMITLIVSILMIVDIGISIYASFRQRERRNNIEATNCLQVVFDKYYPDEFLDEIYVNMRFK